MPTTTDARGVLFVEALYTVELLMAERIQPLIRGLLSLE